MRRAARAGGPPGRAPPPHAHPVRAASLPLGRADLRSHGAAPDRLGEEGGAGLQSLGCPPPSDSPGGRPSPGHTHLSSPEDISSLNSELSLLPGKGTQMSEQGGLTGAGGWPRRSGATRAACSLPGPGPELRGCARGTPPDPGVSVWLGLCSAAALSDTRPTPSHGSQVGLPLPSLPPKCCVCPHTSPRGQDPSDSVLAWPGSTTALLLAQGKLGPNRGQMSTSSFKGQGWTKRGPQSSCSALDRSPHGAPFRARGSVHTEGSAFPWPAPAGLTGTHQGPALATRKQRDFPWRCLGSALSAWAACWDHGRAVGVGGGVVPGPLAVPGHKDQFSPKQGPGIQGRELPAPAPNRKT